MRLFQGRRRLIALLQQGLKEFSLAYRISIAPTLGAAWGFARYHKDALTCFDERDFKSSFFALPVRALRLSKQTEKALTELNIRFVEELLQLSRSSLLERFGQEMLERIDAALLGTGEPLSVARLKKAYRLRRVFLSPVSERAMLELAFIELLKELLEKLDSAAKKTRHLVLEFKRIDAKPIVSEIRLVFSSSRFSHLESLLRRQIEVLEIGAAVEEISLAAYAFDRSCPQPLDRFKQEIGAADSELFNTLKEHLGSERVLRILPLESYIPERSFRYSPFETQSGELVPLLDADRPSVIFPQPERIDVLSSLPEGVPFWLKWRGRAEKVVKSLGPERIEPEWWKESKTASRDYFRVGLASGKTFWVFREGGQGGNWFLHGLWS